MYLIGIVLLECFVFLKIFSLYITGFLFLIYLLSYVDGKEYSGERHWPLFRGLQIWKWVSPIEYVIPNKTEIGNIVGKRIFIILPCATPAPLIWSLGLHGNQIIFGRTTHYIVPPIYMWIPLVRDVLLWTGAVTYSPFDRDGPRSLHNIILDLLNGNRWVCYSPSNFNTMLSDDESQIETAFPSPEMLDFCISEKIQIIPIVVQREHERYRIVQWQWLRKIQAFFYAKIDYCLPLVFWLRFFSNTPPPPLLVQVCSSVDCQLYGNADVLLQILREKVDASILPHLCDKNIKSR